MDAAGAAVSAPRNPSVGQRDVELRKAKPKDAEALLPLISELGYDTSACGLTSCIENYCEGSEAWAYVVEIDGRLLVRPHTIGSLTSIGKVACLWFRRNTVGLDSGMPWS